MQVLIIHILCVLCFTKLNSSFNYPKIYTLIFDQAIVLFNKFTTQNDENFSLTKENSIFY